MAFDTVYDTTRSLVRMSAYSSQVFIIYMGMYSTFYMAIWNLKFVWFTFSWYWVVPWKVDSQISVRI